MDGEPFDPDELPSVFGVGLELDDAEPTPPTQPEYHHDDAEVEAMPVEYAIRGPNDWVISGPLGEHGGGPGRRFPSLATAERWVKQKYHHRVRRRIPEATRNGGNRWAWLIKGEA